MKKVQENLKDFLGSMFIVTYEHKLLMVTTIFVMICTILQCMFKSLYYYGLQLDHLERTLETISIYHLYMWIFDGLTLILIGVLFLYISEGFKFFTKKSLIEIFIKKITLSQIEE